MAQDSQNQTEQNAAPVFSIEKLYVHDASIEVPNAPAIFTERTTPQINVELGNSAQQIEDGIFNVSIKVTVTASSKSSGTAVIENVTRKKTVSHTFSSGSTQGALGEVNAEWIVEDFESGGSLVNFANFGTVTFTGAQATDNGSKVGPSGATLIDIKQNNQVLTSSSVTSNSVKVSYV